MERCALGVWAADEPPPLPEPIRSIVGRLFHRAREVILQRGLSGATPTHEIDDVVAATTYSIESALAEDQDAAVILPLRTTFGVRAWMDLVAGLKAWTKSLDCVPRPGSRATRISTTSDGRRDMFGVGTEPTWRSQALRLRGRPDEAELRHNATLAITEYKTGRVTTGAGHLIASIAAQMRLYLLMGEVLSGRTVTACVRGTRVLDVTWDEEIRRTTTSRLQAVDARFRAGTHVAAEVAAQPGTHCIACRLRPRCASYLAAAPAWWKNDAHHPRPLPLDVWGTATDVRRDAAGWTLRLLDPAGRDVVVRGLRDSQELDSASVGSAFFLFNLEATEDRAAHGRKVQPRAFHERSPSARWRDALQVRCFRSGT